MALPPGGDRARCAVLGSPIGHSLSPVLHRAAYDALGLDWTYDAIEVDATELAGFVAGLSWEWRGLSLTMPLKETAVRLAPEVTETVRAVGACNTLLLEDGQVRTADNTDVAGFVAAWAEHGITTAASALLVGAGATARSAAMALAQIGVRSVVVLHRPSPRVAQLASLLDRLGLAADLRDLTDERELPPSDLAVSTLPAAAVAVSTGVAPRVAAVAAAMDDVGYGPAPSPFLAAAAAAGVQSIDGFALLLHQAARQVELMTGISPAPMEAMRRAGLAALPAPDRSSDG